jgi:histidinol dehydrogenase
MLPIAAHGTPAFASGLARLRDRGDTGFAKVQPVVRSILEDVRKEGDAAVHRYVERFEKRTVTTLFKTAPEGAAALARLPQADASADPSHVAADLLSQAEHDEDAYVLLVSDQRALVAAVAVELEHQLEELPRAAIAREALRRHGQAFVISGRAEWIRHAGAVFVGRLTPEASGDYVAGPSPTSCRREGRFASVLRLGCTTSSPAPRSSATRRLRSGEMSRPSALSVAWRRSRGMHGQ